jgi:hypothetical protein
MSDRDALPLLLGAIDNALCNGSYMTGANLAFDMLCDRLDVDRDALVFDPRWAAIAQVIDGDRAVPVSDTPPERRGYDAVVGTARGVGEEAHNSSNTAGLSSPEEPRTEDRS